MTILITLCSCNAQWLEPSPYIVIREGSKQGFNAQQNKRVQDANFSDSLTLLVITSDQIPTPLFHQGINKRLEKTSADSAVFLASIVAHGWFQEYQTFAQTYDTAPFAVFPVIGTREYAANGRYAYEATLGSRNFYTDIGSDRLIFLDNVYNDTFPYNTQWESDLTWLETILEDSRSRSNIIIFSTLSPFGTDAFTGASRYLDLVTIFSVRLSIHALGGPLQEQRDETLFIMFSETENDGTLRGPLTRFTINGPDIEVTYVAPN